MDESLLNLRWDLTDGFSRRRGDDYLPLENPSRDDLPDPARFRPWIRPDPLPEVARIRDLWFDDRYQTSSLVSHDGARFRDQVKHVAYLRRGLLAPLFNFVIRDSVRHAHKLVTGPFRESLDVEWAYIEAAVRRLALAAVDYRRLYAGEGPEVRGRARAPEYLARAAAIESVYHDPRNPLAAPRHRNWIATYLQQHMHGRLDVAREDLEGLLEMFKLFWEGDYRALLAARQSVPAAPPSPRPEDVARVIEVAGSEAAAAAAIEQHLQEYDTTLRARGVSDLDRKVLVAKQRQLVQAKMRDLFETPE